MLDPNRRGEILKSDILKVLAQQQISERTTGGQGWFQYAEQQISKVLTEKFRSIQESFSELTGHQEKMNYKTFSEFLAREMVLRDFNLTEQLLMKLFARIDQHQKGFITEQDWVNTFGAHRTYDELILHDFRE